MGLKLLLVIIILISIATEVEAPIPFTWVRQYGRLAYAVTRCFGKILLPANANKLMHIFKNAEHLFDGKNLAITSVELLAGAIPGQSIVKAVLTTGEVVAITVMSLSTGGVAGVAIGTAYVVTEALTAAMERVC